jgi:hypothetical protein
MERTVNALPWAAAISFAAGVSATVIVLIVSKDWINIRFPESRGLSVFRWVFPTAFAANTLFWLPVALWARAPRGFAVTGTILAGYTRARTWDPPIKRRVICMRLQNVKLETRPSIRVETFAKRSVV